ncbi:MAG: hypothetical protein V3V08_21600 [Nannocystaceae bacterium]
MKHILFILAVPIALWSFGLGCAENEGGDDEPGHGDHHGSAADGIMTTLGFVSPPASMVPLGEALRVMFTIETDGELHVAEVRACAGLDVVDCGKADEFDLSVPAPLKETHYMAAVELGEGEWTVVGYAHVGSVAHTTAGANVAVLGAI